MVLYFCVMDILFGFLMFPFNTSFQKIFVLDLNVNLQNMSFSCRLITWQVKKMFI